MQNLAFQIERSILKIGNQLNNMRNEDLKNRNLTPTQSEALLFFAEHEGASISELKDHLQISHQAASKLVEKLKEKHYLYASISKEDARANATFLTTEGKAVCASLQQTGSSVGSALLQGFSEGEMLQLQRFLDAALKNLKEAEDRI